MPTPTGDGAKKDDASQRQQVFAGLYDRFASRLFHVACTLLESRHDAEDVVQDVFVALARSSRQVTEIDDIRAYLFAALRHAAAKMASQRKPRLLAQAEFEQQVATPETRMASDEAARLDRALRALPTEQRELVALKIDGGLTFAQIAELLGISANTAASRYRYALEKLRADLKE
jgi:RNA polymerase sigma-70 factor, ECF subfamily